MDRRHPCGQAATRVIAIFSLFAPDGCEETCAISECSDCNSSFLDCYHEHSLDDGKDFTYVMPLSSEEASHLIDLQSKCREPNDKYCGCESHKRLDDFVFEGFGEASDELAEEESEEEGEPDIGAPRNVPDDGFVGRLL